MTYEKVKNLTGEKFKRLCGVKKETFAQMVEIVENQEKLKTKTGRPSKLSLENQVLMTLEYLREYRTYFHIAHRQLASLRIIIEHIYRHLKIFRILSERYRNRKKRFSLRFNLIAAIYNYELCLRAK